MKQVITSPDVKDRIETGALQINNDWPGLFIRGDDALYLATCIDGLLEVLSEEDKQKALFFLSSLTGISNTIKQDVMVQ